MLIDIPTKWRKFKGFFGFRAQSIDDQLWKWYRPQTVTDSGVTVTEDTALTNTAVWNAIHILAQSMSILPLQLFRRLPDDQREKAQEHPYYDLMWMRPNPEMAAVTFHETISAHMVGWGNAYIEKETANDGFIKALWPIPPSRIRVERAQSTGRLLYYFKKQDGSEQILTREQVIHIPGLGFNGIMGYNPIAYHRQSIGLGLTMEKFGARFFGSGMRPSGTLEHPENLSDDAQARLRKQIEEAHSGIDQTHRLLILEEGMKWAQNSIPPEDAQFLQSRKFSIGDVARIFNLPPHMLKDLDRATFSNIEEMSQGFVDYTLAPWLKRREQNFTMQMLDGDAGQLYFEHNVDALLRTNIEKRTASYVAGRQWGWFSANDVLKMENKKGIGEQGDVYMVPMNMVDAELVANPPEPVLPPAPQPLQIVEGEEEAAFIRHPEIEYRTPQSAFVSRNRIVNSFKPLFHDAARAIVNREAIALKRAINRHLKKRSVANFREWMEEFYVDLREYIKKRMGPVVGSYSETVQGQMGEEIGTIPQWDVNRFTVDYLDAMATRYTASSLGQLRQQLEQADPEELVDALNLRIDEWTEKRPDKIAKRESFQMMNAVAGMMVFAAGMSLVWRNQYPSCPYCMEMEGRVVSSTQTFVQKGKLSADGAEETMLIRRDKAHPPLHAGCDCFAFPAIPTRAKIATNDQVVQPLNVQVRVPEIKPEIQIIDHKESKRTRTFRVKRDAKGNMTEVVED